MLLEVNRYVTGQALCGTAIVEFLLGNVPLLRGGFLFIDLNLRAKLLLVLLGANQGVGEVRGHVAAAPTAFGSLLVVHIVVVGSSNHLVGGAIGFGPIEIHFVMGIHSKTSYI